MRWRATPPTPAATPPSTTAGRGRGVHALQIEVNRALYLDEATLAPTARYASLKADLERLFAALGAMDWARL